METGAACWNLITNWPVHVLWAARTAWASWDHHNCSHTNHHISLAVWEPFLWVRYVPPEKQKDLACEDDLTDFDWLKMWIFLVFRECQESRPRRNGSVRCWPPKVVQLSSQLFPWLLRDGRDGYWLLGHHDFWWFSAWAEVVMKGASISTGKVGYSQMGSSIVKRCC